MKRVNMEIKVKTNQFEKKLRKLTKRLNKVSGAIDQLNKKEIVIKVKHKQ